VPEKDPKWFHPSRPNYLPVGGTKLLGRMKATLIRGTGRGKARCRLT